MTWFNCGNKIRNGLRCFSKKNCHCRIVPYTILRWLAFLWKFPCNLTPRYPTMAVFFRKKSQSIPYFISLYNIVELINIQQYMYQIYIIPASFAFNQMKPIFTNMFKIGDWLKMRTGTEHRDLVSVRYLVYVYWARFGLSEFFLNPSFLFSVSYSLTWSCLCWHLYHQLYRIIISWSHIMKLSSVYMYIRQECYCICNLSHTYACHPYTRHHLNINY